MCGDRRLGRLPSPRPLSGTANHQSARSLGRLAGCQRHAPHRSWPEGHKAYAARPRGFLAD